MSTWVPPYFGSYEQLVNALLHDPYLGSGRPRPHMVTESAHADPTIGKVEGPQPDPWRNAAVSYIMSALSMKEIASHVKGALQQQMAQDAESAIEQFLDDFCGTPPGKIPWHWPGPPPWNTALASELAMVANTLQEGALRASLLSVAGRIIEKGMGQALAVGAAGR